MEDKKFKTTLKCSGCVDKATPFLNEAVGDGQWEVDLNAPVKILTVHNGTEDTKVVKALEKAGYRAEAVK